ncbi:MAG TPA: hypothetical protein VFP84_13230 [Kofleriaceae bacterium]|nr:hypothetical protein [Kofleriaceae bacterium]
MSPGLQRVIGTRRAMAIVIAAVMALAATSISTGFLTDDHSFRAAARSTSEHAPAAYDLFRFSTGDAAGNRLRVWAGHLPWWSAPDLKIHFLRPLTSLAFAADVRVFDAAPLGYHLHSLLWYLAVLLGAAALFRRVLPAAAATIALAVFGLAAAHVEAYAWVSARHVEIAGAFAASALACRASARGRRGRWLIGFGLLAIGLTASEAGLAALPLWLALELGDAEARPWRARLAACAPIVVLGVAYLAAYTALGGGTRASGGYHDPAADPIGFVGLGLRRVPILLGDAALGIPAELAHVVAEAKLAVLGVAAAGVVALGVWGTRGAPRSIGWLVAGGVLACVPGAAGYPAGRVLLIPDLAFALVLGLVIDRGLLGRDARWPGRVVAIVLVLAHLVHAPLATWRAIGKLAHRTAATEAIAREAIALAPPSGRVFVIGASDPLVFLYPRGIIADLAPGAVRCWSVLSAARSAQRVSRPDAHTLVIEALDRPLLAGSFDQLFRAPDRPFAVGDEAEQCGATYRVAAVQGGKPSRVEVHLRRSFDDPAIAVLAWQGDALARLALPAVGGSIDLPWRAGPSGAL